MLNGLNTPSFHLGYCVKRVWEIGSIFGESMKEDNIERLSSYSIIRAMCQNGYDNYLDCFVPIVIQGFTDNNFTTIDYIASELNSFFPLPKLMLLQVLNRAENKGYVVKEPNSDRYCLNTSSIGVFTNARKVAEQQVNEFVQDVEIYFKEHLFKSPKSILLLIKSFVNNTGFLLNIKNICEHLDVSDNIIETVEQKYLVQYLREKSQEKSRHAETFREIAMGYIVSQALEWTDIQSVNIKSFNKTQIFLDSNFVFSILGFHGKRIAEPAIELYENLSFFDFNLCIFDFTLRQLRAVLNSYSPDKVIAIEDPQFPSVYNALKLRGWSKKEVKEYVDKLEATIKEKRIQIIPTEITLADGKPPDDTDLASLFDIYGGLFEKRKPKYGYQSNHFGKQHDLAAILMIQRIRKNDPVTINEPRAIFLTSDRKLAEFNQVDMDRPEAGTLPEVLLDTGLTTLLWVLLKGRADIKFSLETIIAAYSRNLFINRVVWEKFQAVFKQVVEHEGIDVKTIPNMFYVNIQNILNEYSDENINLITHSFVEKQMREAKREYDLDREREMDATRTIRLQEEKIAILEIEKQKINEAKESVESSITKKNKIIAILLLLLSLMSVGLVIYHFIR